MKRTKKHFIQDEMLLLSNIKDRLCAKNAEEKKIIKR